MGQEEEKQLIMALYEFAWKISELELGPDLKRLSKKEINDKLTEETTKKITDRIGISSFELHAIIHEMTS